ncbi:uncharacterized protein LOC133287833 [Gastrolobium bilobum]|uniref:uncharacterized protein LOC133287833 n=1 Tax=Gastrolobium bilobum TaxID=150636 RepID=UPI002AB2C866|nr:uncharacterized protein LOC133287833 [Gastrolobium bilobum]
MSAGVCGKRVGYEEIFGSSSPPQCSSVKKSRRSSYGSPNRSEIGFASDNSVSVLLQMFPALDPEVVERVFRNKNCKIEDAIECLGALSSGDIHGFGRDKSQNTDSAVSGNYCGVILDQNQATCSGMREETIEGKNCVNSTPSCGFSQDGMNWVDLFVNEMMNATDLDDARGRAAKLLEAFEQCISVQARVSEEMKHASLKEHLQNLLNDNQILKKAVAIQHERSLEQEEKTKGVQHLKNVLNQYQEKVQSLELNNYALKVHLQRAQESSSISGKFLPPDIF